jgi:5'(3')-deoxyribonucleotidase
MKIGIDLDEVLADFLSALIEYHNYTYGTSLVREQFQSYKFWETWGGTRKEAIQKVYDFHKTSYFKNIKPLVGSQEAISILKQNNDLVIVTSRQDDIAEATKKWIAQNFPNVFSKVYFANHYSQNGSPKTKKQICDSVGVNVLIEDSPEYALECLNPERRILLLDCPWNRSFELPNGIYRVNSWKEILDSI